MSIAGKKNSLDKEKIFGKRVLLRADFDVPLKTTTSGDLIVADSTRIEHALPTIRFLRENRAKTIIVGHLGRPKNIEKDLSLLPVALVVAEKLNLKLVVVNPETDQLPLYSIPHLFFFSGDFRESSTQRLIGTINKSDVAILENIRFYPEEEKNDEEFGKQLSSLADVYVNDCFAVDHREHASIVLPPSTLPSYPGLELKKQLASLGQVLVRPARPFVGLIGGVKLGSKIKGLDKLIGKCDSILLGGGVATLFFAARGYEIGKSVFDAKHLQEAKALLRDRKTKIVLPPDVLVARSPQQPDTARVTTPDKVGPAEMILDIGPESMRLFSQHIREAKTLLWAGPLGLFENQKFSHGTKAVGRIFAGRCSSGKAFGVAGGGDTLEALNTLGVLEDINFISTGGGAMIQYVAGESLPGLQALGL